MYIAWYNYVRTFVLVLGICTLKYLLNTREYIIDLNNKIRSSLVLHLLTFQS